MAANRFIKQLTPFIVFGVAIVAFIFGMMLLTYLLLFGAIVGGILFIVNWIRHKLYPVPKTPVKQQQTRGRIIDTNDWKHLK